MKRLILLCLFYMSTGIFAQDLELSAYQLEESGEVVLYWNANEYCEKGTLAIERAINGGEFELLHQFQEQEADASTCYFEHVDEQWPQAASQLSYRLVHMLNQQKTYSNTLHINLQALQGFQEVNLYPNPAKDWFKLCFVPPLPYGEVQVYDLSGYQVACQPFEGEQISLEFNCGAWPRDCYTVVLFSGGEQLQLRLRLE